MTERKSFPCPSCGVGSSFDPVTLQVEHDEPQCEAWKARQLAPLAPSSAPAVGGTVTHLAPAVVDFECPECHQAARMFPRDKPIGVEHSLPVCQLWEQITGKKDDVERYLIKAGVHIYAPQHQLAPREGVGDANAQSDDAGGEK